MHRGAAWRGFSSSGNNINFSALFFDTVRRHILVIIVVPANRYSCFLGRAFFFFIPAQKTRWLFWSMKVAISPNHNWISHNRETMAAISGSVAATWGTLVPWFHQKCAGAVKDRSLSGLKSSECSQAGTADAWSRPVLFFFKTAR